MNSVSINKVATVANEFASFLLAYEFGYIGMLLIGYDTMYISAILIVVIK